MTPFLTPEQLTDAIPMGGKAAGLWLMHRLGAPVPPWVVVPADRATNWATAAADGPWIAPGVFDLDDGQGIAVRSSDLAEDQRDAAKAGAFDTCFCDTLADLPHAIDRVLASGDFSGASTPSMAVILQKRIKPLLSGVLFSAHPSHAHPKHAYVEIVAGSPVDLVGGQTTPSSLLLNPFRGTIVDEDVDDVRSLGFSDNICKSLCGWLLKIEEALDCAADIEWAIDERGLWLLQARPVTRLHLDPTFLPPEVATSWFFDQRFADPISPLTRSSLLPIIVRVGIEEALALRQQGGTKCLVHDYGGQVYIALSAYHQLLSGVPLRWLTQDLRQLFPSDVAAPKFVPSVGAVLGNLKLIWRERERSVFNFRAWRRFRDGLEGALEGIPDADGCDEAIWTSSWQALDKLTEDFLRIHRWSIALADGGYGLFKAFTRWMPSRLRRQREARLQQQVTLITATANRAWSELEKNGCRAAFIDRFGHRSSSLDYATSTWGESHGGFTTPALPTFNALKERTYARGYLARLLELREEQRFCWEMILARQRRLLLHAGDWLVANNSLAARNAVFSMDLDAVRSALRGDTVPDPNLIATRARTRRIFQTVVRPAHLAPKGSEAGAASQDAPQRIFQGLGASTGLAMGKVCVLRHGHAFPKDIDTGSILVLPCLDPGSTAIMDVVAGLIIERGGLLSHAAINAREYGIPLVIGIPDIVDTLQDGMSVSIDGETGAVEVLD